MPICYIPTAKTKTSLQSDKRDYDLCISAKDICNEERGHFVLEYLQCNANARACEQTETIPVLAAYRIFIYRTTINIDICLMLNKYIVLYCIAFRFQLHHRSAGIACRPSVISLLHFRHLLLNHASDCAEALCGAW